MQYRGVTNRYHQITRRRHDGSGTPHRHTDREHCVVVCLNTKNKIMHMEIAHIGSLNSCLTHPREIFKGPLLTNAAAILFCHIGMKNQWRNYNLLYPQCYINFAFFLMAKLSLKVGWR